MNLNVGLRGTMSSKKVATNLPSLISPIALEYALLFTQFTQHTQFTYGSHLVLDIRMMDALPVFGLASGGLWAGRPAGRGWLLDLVPGQGWTLVSSGRCSGKVRGCSLRTQEDSEDSLQ